MQLRQPTFWCEDFQGKCLLLCFHGRSLEHMCLDSTELTDFFSENSVWNLTALHSHLHPFFGLLVHGPSGPECNKVGKDSNNPQPYILLSFQRRKGTSWLTGEARKLFLWLRASASFIISCLSVVKHSWVQSLYPLANMESETISMKVIHLSEGILTKSLTKHRGIARQRGTMLWIDTSQ